VTDRKRTQDIQQHGTIQGKFDTTLPAGWTVGPVRPWTQEDSDNVERLKAAIKLRHPEWYR
jgi:hypothetical protein